MCTEVVCSLVATLSDVTIGNNHLCFKLWTQRAHFEANKHNYRCIPVELWRHSYKRNYYLAKGSDHAMSSKGSKGSDHHWETLQNLPIWKTHESNTILTVSNLKTLQPCQNPIYLILNNNKKPWNKLILKSQKAEFLTPKDRADRNPSSMDTVCALNFGQFYACWYSGATEMWYHKIERSRK